MTKDDDGGGEDAGFSGLARVFGWIEKVLIWWNSRKR